MTFSRNFKEQYIGIVIMILDIIMILVKHCQCTTFCHIKDFSNQLQYTLGLCKTKFPIFILQQVFMYA